MIHSTHNRNHEMFEAVLVATNLSPVAQESKSKKEQKGKGAATSVLKVVSTLQLQAMDQRAGNISDDQHPHCIPT